VGQQGKIMMRCGHYLGTLNWETDIVYLMGSDRRVLTKNVQEEMLKQIMQGNGIINNTD